MIDYPVAEYKALIRSRLSEYRYRHSMCVAAAAVSLAEKYGGDVQKAYVAGILHDVMKEETPEVQLQYIDKVGIMLTPLQLENQKLYHAMSGYAYCKDELGIDDQEILTSILYHTTSRPHASLMEKIIYIADFISDDRTYPDVNTMREKAETSLDGAMLYAMQYTIIEAVKKGKTIHTDTVDAYNEIVMAAKIQSKEIIHESE